MPLTTPEAGAGWLLGAHSLQFAACNDDLINPSDDGVNESETNAADNCPLQSPCPGGMGYRTSYCADDVTSESLLSLFSSRLELFMFAPLLVADTRWRTDRSTQVIHCESPVPPSCLHA